MEKKNRGYEMIDSQGGVPIKAWVRGVPVEAPAVQQLQKTAKLPFIFRWMAVMPDVHHGKGSTVGSVIPTHKAIIPAAVGVDIGCGMMAVRTSLTASDMPDNLRQIRLGIEAAVPHGRTNNGGPGDKGAWAEIPDFNTQAWRDLKVGYDRIIAKHPKLDRGNHVNHLCTLGSGNHFIEVCLDEADQVWFMLHSGSRGVGNRIGSHFIELAKEDMRRWFVNLPDQDLAYLPEGTEHFDDYWHAVMWAQDFAMTNRRLMMEAVIAAVRGAGVKPFTLTLEAVNCHHNYVAKENHYGQNVFITRKGAVRARQGDMGIIPGSMGARSYIVRGKGDLESFCSCSHGAGRTMSRTDAKKRFTVADLAEATKGIECRKDRGVLDEIPDAYKSIDAVMAAQSGLVEIVHTLRQIICVKGEDDKEK